MKTITLTPTKTYKTRDNAIKAVEKKLGHIEGNHFAQLR